MLASLGLALVTGAAAQGAPLPTHADRRPFQGLGTWVDGYDFSRELVAAPAVTAASVQRMKDRGVRTIWLQAAKQSAATPGALLSPDRLGAILTTAHAKGLRDPVRHTQHYRRSRYAHHTHPCRTRHSRVMPQS